MPPTDDGLSTVADESHIDDNANGQAQLEPRVASKDESNNVVFEGEDEAEDAGLIESEFRYGWFGWTPKWLQTFNIAPWLLVVLSGFCTAQGLVINGYINVGIGAIERRFDLSSRASGLIVSMYDITCAVLVLFVTYVGARGHKPRWCAWGLIIMGTGSVLFALPHFTTGPYEPVAGSRSILCTGDGGSGGPQCQDSADGDDPSLSNYFYVFLLAQMFHGLGALPLYTLGVTLLDESVTTKQTGLYLAWFYGFSAVGPAVGLISGGVFLGLFTDLQAENVEVTSSDPAWVGAWWIGFLIGAIIAYIVAIPMSGYPKELPTTAKIRAEKESQAHVAGHEEEVTRPSFGSKLADVPKSVWYLLCNPTFLFVSLAASSESLVVSGFATFSPKIFDIQYGLSPGVAAAVVGIFAVPAAVGSTFLGGWLIKRFDLKVRGMLRLCIVCVIIVIVFAFVLLLICPLETVAGLTTNYYANESGLQDTLVSTCNEGCGCDPTSDYNPVCGDNNIQYFDPCHAGCKSVSENGVFSNCTCLGLGNWTESSLQVVPGQCPVDCGLALPIFLAGFFITMFFNFMPSIPGTNTCLRCVPDSQRSFALGVQWLFARLLGSVPGPILFGTVLDSSCLLWQDNCGSRGACWFYDRQMLAVKLVLIAVGFKGASLLFFSLSLAFYKTERDETKAADPGAVEISLDEKGPKRASFGRIDSTGSTAEIVKYAAYDSTIEALEDGQ